MTIKSFSPTRSMPPATLSSDRVPVLAPGRDELEQVIPFSHYLWLLRRHWWKVLLFVCGCCSLSYFAASRITPVYESTARLVLDPKTSSSVIGETTATATSGSEADQLFNTQLQLIQSDAVLRPVAQYFHMLPGKSGAKLTPGMNVADAPVYLKGLSVTHPPNSLLININYRSTNQVEAAAIANAIAHSYISRQMEMRVHSSMEESAFMEKQMADLKKKMDDSASALAGYERQLGVINPDEKTSIVAARLMQLNTEYTESQNDRIRKEADLHALQSGSLAAIQVSPQALALSKMEDTVRATQEKMEAAKTIYGTSNIEYKRTANELAEVNRQYAAMKDEVGKRIEVEYQEARNRERMLQASLLQTKGESDALNAHSMEYQELKREAEANKSLYSELFRKVTEAGINGAFQGSAIRVADDARPQLSPVFPNKLAFVLIGFLFSLSTSLILIIILDMSDSSLRDPGQVRRELEIEVLGVLPLVNASKLLLSSGQLAVDMEKTHRAPGKWFSTPGFYEESVDTLLSSLCGNQTQPLYSLLITSANPGEGKSSCVAHMASAYARQGYRTLLIDADLRCPSQQKIFALAPGLGLTDAILNGQSLQEIRREIEGNTDLHVVTAGYSHKRLYNYVSRTVTRLLAEGRSEYDMVFVDAPPMLCFAEPLQLAAMVDGVLIVNHAGVTSRKSVVDVLSTLRRIRANTLGIVLNKVKYTMSDSYEPYGAYYRSVNRSLT